MTDTPDHRAIVAEIDAIRNADGAPPPTFAQRAEDGSITWAKAATEAKRWKQERNDAIKRVRGSVQKVVQGWPSVRMFVERPDHPWIPEILDGLSYREPLAKILGELRPDTEHFYGLVPDTDDPARALAAAALERVTAEKKPDHVLYALLAALCGALSHDDR